MSRPIFKETRQGQTLLFPPSLEEIVPANHPVRVVNSVIDKINLDSVYEEYKGGGTSSFSPRMLLKVIVYCYMLNIYSSRRIESALKENIFLMWLSGMSYPDHNTINRFRSGKLKDKIQIIFPQIVMLLHEAGLVDIKDLYTDGTKIEANANRYTFVWGKSIANRKAKIAAQLEEILNYAEKLTESELLDTRPTSYEEVNAEKVSEAINKIDEALQDKKKDVDKKIRQKINRVKKAWPKQLERYANQETNMGDRNSYSKTDKDATFMRMKEDHMMNGQLKPGYNWQISTNNQIIVNYSIHQTTADTITFINHVELYKRLYQTIPITITADAGYGSEENYDYAEKNGIEAFIKYNYFHKEQKKKWQSDISKSDNLYYNKENDCFYCPMGQAMPKIYDSTTITKTGYKQKTSKYRAQNCNGCPLRGACHKSRGNRTIEVNFNAKRLKAKAKEMLLEEAGIIKRKRRPIEPEAVFGNIKYNKKFKRFLLRGKEKVEIEAGLVAISHNLAKLAA